MSRPSDPYDWESWAWDTIEIVGKGLSARAALVLVQLSKHGNAAGVARPSARTLGTLTGCTGKTARKALNELVEVGLIVAVGTHQRATVWRFEHPESATPGVAVGTAETATPGVAVDASTTATRVRTECGQSATPGSPEGEELQRQDPLSPQSEAQDVGEQAVSSNNNGNGGHVEEAAVAQAIDGAIKGMPS